MDDFHEEAPGRLADRLRGSLSGHHPLFDLADIRAALAAGLDPALAPEHANAVGTTLVALAQDGYAAARNRVDALAPAERDALIRLYFQLLGRSREVRGRVH